MLRPRFPAELLDQIVDHLHDTSDALKRCCLVSKSWVPRTRRHLFADVNFRTEKDLRSWKNAFPDPSTSPACYTKNLIWCPEAVVAADTEEHGLIPAFSRVVHFEVGISGSEASLIPFHGFSPALKSLRITCTGLTSSPILNLLHSFPLVEDFSVIACDTLLIDNADEQPTIIQPPLTGALKLSAFGGMDSIISRLFFPSNGLRFRKLELSLNCEEDVQPMSALVEACCLTLESLEISVGIYDELPLDPIDLSTVTGLKYVALGWRRSPQWVAMTLRTITRKHRNLQQISLNARWESYIRLIDSGNDPTNLRNAIGETLYQGWLELDEVLVQLWESHSVRSEVVYDACREICGRKAGRRVENLLSGAMARGIVHLVERCEEC